jgi:hypothetical protein
MSFMKNYEIEEGKRKYKYNPAFPELLLAHMAEGYDFKSFGAVAKVCEKTLHLWVHTIPEFAHAKAVGTASASLAWQKDMKDNRFEGKAYNFRVAEMFMKNVAGWTNRLTIEGNPDKPIGVKIGDLKDASDQSLDGVIEAALNDVNSNSSRSDSIG